MTDSIRYKTIKNYLINTDKNNWQFKTITSDKKLYGNIILKTIEIQVQSCPIRSDSRQLKQFSLKPIQIIDNSKQLHPIKTNMGMPYWKQLRDVGKILQFDPIQYNSKLSLLKPIKCIYN